jgi:hypothetical protein
MQFPNVTSSFGLAVLYFALQWILSHIGEFSIPPAYLDIVSGLLDVAIAAVAKMAKERKVMQPGAAAARGETSQPTPGYCIKGKRENEWQSHLLIYQI